MRLIAILLFVSSVCFGQYAQDRDGAYVMWGDKYLVGTQGIIPNPPDPPDPPPPINPGDFEGIVLFDIDFSEQGSPPYVNSTATARSFFPGVSEGNFSRGGTAVANHPEVDSIVLLAGDPCWRITILDDYAEETGSKYGVEWQVYMEGAAFNNIQLDFDLYLGSDWDMMDYSTGGKLPGIGAADSVGGPPPSAAGYTGAPGEGFDNKVAYGIDDEIGTYSYVHQMTPYTSGLSRYPYSTNGNGPFVYNTEQWYHITLRGKQNAIGSWDATLELLVDGVSRMLWTGAKFRDLAITNYDWLPIEIFAGGTTAPGFAGMSAWIDNLVYSVPDYSGTIGIGNTIGDENIPYTYTRVE